MPVGLGTLLKVLELYPQAAVKHEGGEKNERNT